MTTSARALVVVLTSWSVACDTQSTQRSPFPTAPTAAPTAAPAPAPPRLGGERWTLTTTLTAVTGGDTCGLTLTPGRSARWHLFLSRLADNRAAVVIANQQNANARHKTGFLAGDELAVTDGGHLDAIQCNGTHVAMDIESRVLGTIVDDGHALVGEEVATARLASGQTLTWFYEWRATFP